MYFQSIFKENIISVHVKKKNALIIQYSENDVVSLNLLFTIFSFFNIQKKRFIIYNSKIINILNRKKYATYSIYTNSYLTIIFQQVMRRCTNLRATMRQTMRIKISLCTFELI